MIIDYAINMAVELAGPVFIPSLKSRMPPDGIQSAKYVTQRIREWFLFITFIFT